MSLINQLIERANNTCELCKSSEQLVVYTLPPSISESMDRSVLVCTTCKSQIETPQTMDSNHWRCLNDSMWSEHLPVQILSWRLLNLIKSEGWPQDLLDMMYLDEEALAFAKSGLQDLNAPKHLDGNGNILENGDSVVLIKDLDVKGSSITAKRGTTVRNIRLDRDNTEYIEGKVDGQQIVILTKYVKKS